jgi:hypothetical protein
MPNVLKCPLSQNAKSISMPSVEILIHCAYRHYGECHYTECSNVSIGYQKCFYTSFGYAECHYAEYRSAYCSHADGCGVVTGGLCNTNILIVNDPSRVASE